MKIIAIGTDRTVFDKHSAVRERTEAYARLFDEYHYIVYTPPGFRPEVLPDNLFLYPTNSPFFFLRPFAAARIAARIIRERGIKMVSVQDPAETGFAGWLLKRKFGITLHIQIHADFFSPFFRKNSWKELIRYWLARFIIPYGDKFRVVSSRIAEALHSAFSIQHSALTILPIFVDRERIASAEPSFNLHQKYPEFDFIILMASRLTREKNISLALEAFLEFLKEFPKSGLVIVGDGPQRKSLEFSIQHSALSDSVRFEGWQNDLMPYYKGADLYILTSNFEGYSMSVVEAVAAALPVVMTDVGVAGEIIKNGETGLVVPPKDKKRLVEALLFACRNYGKMLEMAQKAKNFVLGMTPETSDEYLEMYRKSFL